MELSDKVKVPKSVGGNTIALTTEELKKQGGREKFTIPTRIRL